MNDLTRKMQSLTPDKQKLLELYLKKKQLESSIPNFASIQPAEKRTNYPLSSAQKRLYILNQFEEQGTAYNITLSMLVEGEVNKERLEWVFDELIKRHETLRTSFSNDNGYPVQQVHELVEFKVEYGEEDEEKAGIRIKEFIRPFDLGKAPLLRVIFIKIKEERYIMLCDMHHIIADGLSMAILINEFFELYTGNSLPPLKLQYKDYAVWQQQVLEKGLIKKQEEYWKEVFGVRNNVPHGGDTARFKEIPVLNLPVDYPRPLVQSFEGDEISFTVNRETAGKFYKFAKDNSATTYMALLAVFNTLLMRYTGQEDIVVGLPIAGRSRADLDKIIGMFVNTLAIRNYPVGNKTFRGFLSEVKENALNAYENQEYQFEELLEKLEIRRDISRNPLFDVMLAQQNIEKEGTAVPGLKIKPYTKENRTAKFDLSLKIAEGQDALNIIIEYCTKLFNKETIGRMAVHFNNILQEALSNPGLKLFQIEMMTAEEKRQLLDEFNDTDLEYTSCKTIQQLFEEQVALTPDRIAVVYEEKQLTYRALNERSNQLARALREKGLKPGGEARDSIVALMVERSPEMIIGIMGILKAGGAYLPIDPECPGTRIRYMLQDSAAAILCTQHKFDSRDDIWDKDVLYIDDVTLYQGDSSKFEPIGAPERLAYVIYTSGTTGKPKGVMIKHRNVANLISALRKDIYGKYESNLNIALLAPYIFDASVKQIFAALLLGHSLFIVPEEARTDGESILKYYDEHSIDISDGTPIHLSIITNTLPAPERNLRLKQLIIGGDMLASKTVNDFYTRYGQPKPVITNIYGPTECTVDTVNHGIEANDLGRYGAGIPIGKPMANVKIYILGKNLELLHRGAVGELCISGECVGGGYLNNPELTAQKFIPNPFYSEQCTMNNAQFTMHNLQCSVDNLGLNNSELRIQNSELIYKTGDLARWLPDGNIEILGRMDHQVKIRGFRIELGEIEAQLLKYEAIKEAVVVALDDKDGNKYLCAYIAPFHVGTFHETSLHEIRDYLAMELPEYMIPAYFVKLDKLPVTSNGKVDRRALPPPDEGIKTGVAYAAPRNKIEEILVMIWEEILERKGIGIDENFFELGGNSIKAIQVSARLKKYQLQVKNRDLFLYPTIRRLIGFVESDNLKIGEETETASAVYSYDFMVNNIENIPEIKVLSNIEPFNDVFYKNCFHNAFFPVIFHFGRGDLPLLVNDINVYKYSFGGGILQLEVGHLSLYSEEKLMEEMGINAEAKAFSEDIINDIIKAIARDRPVIISVDCFYESIRLDYQSKHWPHALLIYGYNLGSQIFYIIEHEEINSTLFKKLTIGFNDIANAYGGYIRNFHEGNMAPTFFEFYTNQNNEIDGDSVSRNMERYRATYVGNLGKNKDLIVKGIEEIKTFAGDFGQIMAKEAVLKENINNLLFDLNGVIKAKTAERYNITKLFGEQSDIVKKAQTVVNNWVLIRANLERYAVTTIYDLKMSGFIQERLKQIYDIELGLIDTLLSLPE